jgi:hypothetical protein
MSGSGWFGIELFLIRPRAGAAQATGWAERPSMETWRPA